MNIKSKQLINIILRSATLGTRFLFIFFLAKYLDPSLVGYYGIFTATIGYALYLVGLDFYTYVSREIVKTPANQRGKLLKSQAALSGLLYLVLLPLGIWLLAQSNWPSHLAWWFIPILALEHLNQEISRFLITLSEQLTASLILFLRQGSWALIIIGLMIYDENTRSLEWVMTLWAGAGLAATIMGFWKLKKLKITGWKLPIDWDWVRKGVAVSSAFLLATLALRSIQTIDRYWLEALGGINMVGAYVLLLGVASSLLTFLDAAVFSFAYPLLIVHNHKGEFLQAREKVKQIFLQTLMLSSLFGLASWLILPYFLTWIGNPLYQQAAAWYPWLLAAMILNALGQVPHYALYALGNDKPIIYSHLLSLLVFCFATWVCSGTFSAMAVPIGINAAFAVILLIKAFTYFVFIKKENNKKPIHF